MLLRSSNVLPSRGPEQQTQDEGSDLVHANCNAIFKKGDQDRWQLTSQLSKASDTARKWNLERAQLQAKTRKLVSELNGSKHNTQDLENQLGESALDSRNYVPREVHEMALRDPLSSVTKTVESRLSESHNAFMSTLLPDSDVAQGSWVEQSDQFGMLGNPVVPDITVSTCSTSNPLALPNFDDYVAMPDT
ncbi:hypothetical protein DTO013F2_8639 [Penicillium roqueforti]|nr:hypothetical protein DTO013F2_8639 [Penicillium roqueforti]